MSASVAPCRLADCPVGATGKCKRNFDPVDSCPDFGPGDSQVELSESEERIVEQTVPDLHRFPSSDVMYVSDLVELLRAERPRIVALVGEQKAGKTTLLASLYQHYCRGPFADHRFAGSRTLTAFAKRHHLSLLSSSRTVPTTPRTSRDDPVSFFHLMLKPLGPHALQHLVISDRSGEAFDAARVDTSLISELHEVRQAGRVCFLLDGARLMADDQRAGYTRRFKQMIRALNDNGALRDGAPVEILTTKVDKLLGSPNSRKVLSMLADYEQGLLRDFGASGVEVSCHRICALPRSDYSTGYVGLEDTVRRWMAPRVVPDVTPGPVPDAIRQIDRVSARWFPVAAS
jgi:hypothetical protein